MGKLRPVPIVGGSYADDLNWRGKSAAQRFAENTIPVPEAGCLLWTGATSRTGYGRIGVDRKKVPAHRYAWTVANGPIPEGASVCHKCDTPSCVNPAHLFLGTPADNAHDRDRKGRQVTARGSQHRLAKINEAQAAEILALRGKERQVDTAARFGISQSVVSKIQLRRAWAHG